MKKSLLSLLALLFVLSCKQQTENKNYYVIPVVYDQTKIAPFSESGYEYQYEILPLSIDTSNTATFIGDAYRFVAYKDRFYISDGDNGIKIFNTKGEFIKLLVRGNGPGEIARMYNDLFIDRENGLFMVSQNDKILRYTLDGEYIDSEPFEHFGADVYKFGDYYIAYDGLTSHDSSYVKIFNHKTDKVIGTLLPKQKIGSGSGWMAWNRFVSCDGDIYFNIPYSRDLFKITKGDSTAQKIAEFSNVVNYTECPDMEFWGVIKYAYAEQQNILITTLAVIKGGNLLIFNVSKSRTMDDQAKETEYRVLYDQQQQKLFMHPIQSSKLAFNDENYEYLLVDPSEFNSKRDEFVESEKTLMNELSELINKNGMETNPYIVKIKIIKK